MGSEEAAIKKTNTMSKVTKHVNVKKIALYLIEKNKLFTPATFFVKRTNLYCYDSEREYHAIFVDLPINVINEVCTQDKILGLHIIELIQHCRTLEFNCDDKIFGMYKTYFIA